MARGNKRGNTALLCIIVQAVQDKETSIAMIKELRNVLTVRTANKSSLKVKRPRKTKSKHMKKKGKVLSQNHQTSDQLSKDALDANVDEQCTAISPAVSTDVQQDTNTGLPCDTTNDTLCNIKDDTPMTVSNYDTKQDVSCDAEDDNTLEVSLHSTSYNQPALELLMEDTNSLMMRHVATMAAKMALKQSAGSNKQEEVFGSEQ